jgi:SAM-dependent methyltransferase
LLSRALVSGARVLDAGCGRRSRLAGYRDRIADLVGVDIDGSACAGNRALDTVVVADLCGRLPFPSGSFDLVYSNFVIEHLQAPAEAFAEWRRLLRSGGGLILLTSNRASPPLAIGALIPRGARQKLKRAGAGVAEEDVIATRYRANTPWRLDKLLVRAGFRPVDVEHVATLHRYAARAPMLEGAVRAVEQRLPPKLRSTIVAWYRAV